MNVYIYIYFLILPYFPTDDPFIPLVIPTTYPHDDLSDGEQAFVPPSKVS